MLTIISQGEQNLPVKQGIIDPFSTDGKFDIRYSGVSPARLNMYALGIYDRDGRPAQTQFFQLDTINHCARASNILATCTMGYSTAGVTRQQILNIVGYATPGSRVEFRIDGQPLSQTTIAGPDGYYKLQVSVANYSFGLHYGSCRQITTDNMISNYSPLEAFLVSRACTQNFDLNGDGKININDWSIFLTIWGSNDATARKRIDFDCNGVTDLTDFSIFMKVMN